MRIDNRGLCCYDPLLGDIRSLLDTCKGIEGNCYHDSFRACWCHLKRYFTPQVSTNAKLIIEVQTQGSTLRHASQKFQSDRDAVLAAVSNDGSALVHASKLLRNDKRIVLAALHNNGAALRFASIALREDADAVLEAVNQNGLSLFFAMGTMKESKEAALVAVKQNGLALRYVCISLKGDPDVCRAAAEQNSYALQYALTSDQRRTIRDHLFAQRGVLVLLQSTRRRFFLQMSSTRKNVANVRECDDDSCVLSGLTRNGIHHAINIYQRIAEYACVSFGKRFIFFLGVLPISPALANMSD